jgi:hypothetical protein
MSIEVAELDRMQNDYRAAVEIWIDTIQQEEALALVNHNVAQVEEWEHAGSREETARGNAKAAKKAYEDALRQEFFNF